MDVAPLGSPPTTPIRIYSEVRPFASAKSLADALPQGGIEVAGVLDDDIREAHGMSGVAQAGENLLVDAIMPADVGMIVEQPHLADQRGRAVAGGGALLHDVGRVVVVQFGHQAA